MHVLVIGHGAIGSAIAARAAQLGARVTVHDEDPAARAAAQAAGHEVAEDAGPLLGAVDLVVEAAGQRAVQALLLPALAAGTRCLVMTTGALLDPAVRDQVRAARGRLILPSGGIAGVDAVRALAGHDVHITLETRKPPTGLGSGDPPTGEELLFEGSAHEAWTRFPKNVNVAATLALESGTEPTVRVVVDPALKVNQHTVTIQGEGVDVRTVVRSPPSDNPRTSLLAVLSGVAEVDRALRTLGASP